jgi:hypothetical protein
VSPPAGAAAIAMRPSRCARHRRAGHLGLPGIYRSAANSLPFTADSHLLASPGPARLRRTAMAGTSSAAVPTASWARGPASTPVGQISASLRAATPPGKAQPGGAPLTHVRRWVQFPAWDRRHSRLTHRSAGGARAGIPCPAGGLGPPRTNPRDCLGRGGGGPARKQADRGRFRFMAGGRGSAECGGRARPRRPCAHTMRAGRRRRRDRCATRCRRGAPGSRGGGPRPARSG